jgi:putative lipoic acid-binding regulatory protein
MSKKDADAGHSGLDGEESLIRYPAELSVKAMGLNDTLDGIALQPLIESLVLPLIEPAKPQRIDTRESSGGKYLSVRVHFTATSQGQLQAIYAALHAEPRVLFTL